MESANSNEDVDTVGSDNAIDVPLSKYRSEIGEWSLKRIDSSKNFFNFGEFDISFAGNFKFDQRFQN